MKITKIEIKNFRSIDSLGLNFDIKELCILIGNNGTSKTTILEAINYCLSPYFLSGRLKHTDFHKGIDEPIIIKIEFDSSFVAILPDGYAAQRVDCNGIYLEVKKRDRASPGKSFSDTLVITHYAVPNRPKDNDKGWKIKRKSGKFFNFDERQLALSGLETEALPRSFYFGKSRDKQLQKGFNSSISTILEDFNWRFSKQIREEGQIIFSKIKSNFEKEIMSKIDAAAIQKSFETLNEKLKGFDLQDIKLSFIDGNAPFDSAFICQNLEIDLPINTAGSGIEMVVSLLFLETLASLSKESIIILIDEPELHLHPGLQDKLIHYLTILSKNNQIVFSTHSPYFFKNCLIEEDVSLFVTKRDKNKIVLTNACNGSFGLFPWSPSWGEINYIAYDLCIIEFHNELYGYIQEVKGCSTERDIEAFFQASGLILDKAWIRLKNGVPTPSYNVTLMTFIRNTVHHPENKNNHPFTNEELKASIDIMISLISTGTFIN